MEREANLVNFVRSYLPPMAKLIMMEKPYKKSAILMADLDGDRVQEIIAVYNRKGENYVIIIKNFNSIWHTVANIKGRSVCLNHLYYLAGTEIKKGMYGRALEIIEIGIIINSVYPSQESWLRLKQQAQGRIGNRAIKLYPALVKTRSGTKWGYINDKGDFIIKPKYDFAYDFGDNSLAIVGEKELFGIIDELGRYVVKPKYDSINEFSEGRAIVIDKNISKIIDEEGKELTSKPYTFIGNFKEGRAIAEVTNTQGNDIYGYLDRQGNEVVPLKYEYAGDYNQGKAVVKVSEGQYRLLDINGQILKNYKYASIGDIGDGLLAFKKNTGDRFGYMDQNENVVIQPKYTFAQPFKGGRAIVNISENYLSNYGLIDKTGRFVISPQYNDINLLDENRFAIGRALVKDKPYLGSMYAISDIDGRFLTDFVYKDVLEYKNGYASASDGINTFFINTRGEIAKNLPVLSGRGTLSFDRDLIKADVDHRLSYLDQSGNIVWKQATTIPLNNQYLVKEEKYKPNKDYLVYYPQIEGMKNAKAGDDANNKLKELSLVKPIDSNAQLDYNYLGDFSVELFRKRLLVMQLFGYEYHLGAAHGMPMKNYAHVDVESGRIYELKDLFKKDSNYVKVLSDIIGKQIKNDEQYSYVWQDSYKGIKEDQPFFITEDALNIYFYPYDIAPYVAGFPTFKIPFKDIIDIIDTNGEFWKAFN